MTRPTCRIASILAAAALFGPAWGARAKSFKIEPGPATISEEEAALAGRDSGEHAVILVDETYREDVTPYEAQTTHHFRAKIFANEGRDLANIDIPTVKDYTSVRKFWGRTILPDGRSLEISLADLQEQGIVESRLGAVGALRAALPGVVPGAVIDYGWVMRTVPSYFDRVEMQRRHRVVLMRYRWRPFGALTSAYRIARGEGRDVKASLDMGSVHVEAHDLPPLLEEPYMPPTSEVQTSLYLYYGDENSARDDYWTGVSNRIECRVKGFNRSSGPIRDAIAKMGIAPGADLDTRLRRAYAWMAENLKRTDLLSAEEIESAAEEEKENADKAKRVLAAGEGTAHDFDLLFIGIARELGAEANLVFAADRTQNYWDAALHTVYQFAGTFVAVRAPGKPLSESTLVDAGSGLPYGEVPWYYAGVLTFVVGGKKADQLPVPASQPSRNRSSTVGTVAFDDGNEVMVATWQRVGVGQHGLDERRHLRDLAPGERAERIRELCGEGGDIEIATAEAPGLDAPMGQLEVKCEVEMSPGSLDGTIGVYTLVVDGPWFEPVPVLDDESRVHPVIFRFLRSDLSTIQLEPPEHFAATVPPAGISLTGPFGTYTLAFEKSGDAYKVTRSFVLSALSVPVARYGELRSFLTQVRKADRTSVEFRRAGTNP